MWSRKILCEIWPKKKRTKEKQKISKQIHSYDRKFLHPFWRWPPHSHSLPRYVEYTLFFFSTRRSIFTLLNAYRICTQCVYYINCQTIYSHSHTLTLSQTHSTHTQIGEIILRVIRSLLHRDFSICSSQFLEIIILTGRRLVDVVCTNRLCKYITLRYARTE